MTNSTLTMTLGATIQCCRCGTPFAMSADLERVRRVDHEIFYCPLGHQQHWPAGKTQEQKLQEQINRERSRAASLSAQLDQEKASHSSTKGQLTKAKKRAANGVCPCCNRSFVNVARHVAGQHPEFAAEVSR